MRTVVLFTMLFLVLWVALCLGDSVIVSNDTNINSSQKVAADSAHSEVQK